MASKLSEQTEKLLEETKQKPAKKLPTEAAYGAKKPIKLRLVK